MPCTIGQGLIRDHRYTMFCELRLIPPVVMITLHLLETKNLGKKKKKKRKKKAKLLLGRGVNRLKQG